MNIVYVSEKKLIGLALKNKTTNENGQSSIDCLNLWHEFHKHKYAEAIQNKLSEEIYGVYFDYEGDYNKPFSYFIGYAVDENTTVPEGLQTLTIPDGEYEKFVAKGIMPESVTKVWKDIWVGNYQRTYKIDFEVFDERSRDWNDGEVDVYLSVTP